MPISNRHRYKSGREKYKQGVRNAKIIFSFLSVGIAIWVFKERVAIWDWLQTYFY